MGLTLKRHSHGRTSSVQTPFEFWRQGGNRGPRGAMPLLPFAAVTLNFDADQDKTRSRDAPRDEENVRRE
jgi:hypothetical protein